MPKHIFLTYLFVLGSMVGSFLNVVIARLPAGQSIVRPRSRCPKCGDSIPAWLNVPILSWFVLRGRCRACAQPISFRYPMVETLTACLFLAIGVRFGWSLATLAGLILAGSLVAITFIDLDIWEIPDEISVPGVVVGCALRPFAFDVPWYDGIAGAAIGASFLWLVRWGYFQLRKVEGMGLGDVKLIAMIGAFVGPLGLVPTILVASVAGTIIGGTVILLGGRDDPEQEANEAPTAEPAPPADAPSDGDETAPDDEEDDWVPPPNAVPFGPFLSIGALVQLLFGPALVRLVFGLLY